MSEMAQIVERLSSCNLCVLNSIRLQERRPRMGMLQKVKRICESEHLCNYDNRKRKDESLNLLYYGNVTMSSVALTGVPGD